VPQEKICQLIISERTGKPIDIGTLEKAAASTGSVPI
jgi:hypothetical protein